MQTIQVLIASKSMCFLSKEKLSFVEISNKPNNQIALAPLENNVKNKSGILMIWTKNEKINKHHALFNDFRCDR